MNTTGIPDSFAVEPPIGIKAVFVSLYALLTIGTIFGNLLVTTAFYKFSNLRTVSNSILVSLSVADMLMAVVFVLHITNILGAKTSHRFCDATSMLNLSFNSIIILHLALISVERFIAVKFSLRYQSMVTHRRALIASIAVWLWGIGVSMVFPHPLKADGFETFEEFLGALTPCFDHFNTDKPFILQSNSVKAYLIFLLMTLLVVPIAIVVISYSYIFNIAYKQRKQISHEDNLQASMKREMKAARTVAIVVGLCLASFVPLLVILYLRVLTSTKVRPQYLYGTYFAASLNALWNPLIYCWRNESFRTNVKRLLTCNP